MMIEARCNRCGRSTIDPDDMSNPDDMPQPDGRPCGGTFIVPPVSSDDVFTPAPTRHRAVDGTPEWAYDYEGECVDCGFGYWTNHGPKCELRAALDALLAARNHSQR